MDKKERSQNVRQSWDLRPFAAVLQHLPLCSSYNIQRNYMGLENNCIQEQLGQIQDQKIQKDKIKMNCYFWRARSQKLGAKAGQVLRMPTVPTSRRGGETTWAICPARPLGAPLPSPHTKSELDPFQGAGKGTCYLFSLPPAAGPGAPVKPCLNFLSGL